MNLTRRQLLAAAAALGVAYSYADDTRTTQSIYVPMRDKVKIALDITLPARANAQRRVPTVLIMTRYWRQQADATGPTHEEQYFSDRGFAVVTGDVRGTGASFGDWRYHRSRDETLDFGELIDWIVRQPWSDGTVVGWGLSYSANTADWMAERDRPAFKAEISRFPDYDPYADLYFPGGVPNAYMGRNWGLNSKNLDLNIAPAGIESKGVRPVDGDDGTLLQQAIAGRRDVPSVWEGLKDVIFRDDRPPTWKGASFDEWGIHSHAAAVERSGVPIQSWASWLDSGTANGVLHRFMTLSNPQRVFIGAWSHGGVLDADPFAPVTQPTSPPLDDQYAKDLSFLKSALGAAPRIGRHEKVLTYWTIGAERWQTTKVWPPPSTPHTLYFASEGRLVATPPAASPTPDIYAVNFGATTGKHNRWATNNNGGDVDYGDRSQADRFLLVYTGAPLASDLEVTGQAIVTLHLSSTHTDGAFFVYLEDVAPEGIVRYITEGQLRGLHRKISKSPPPYIVIGPWHSCRRQDAEPLPPGEVVELQFALMPVSALFPAGHRIRVALAGADADTFARVPSAGDPVWRVHRSAEYASHIVLPVVTGGRDKLRGPAKPLAISDA
jgi:putative CocE/NonD family hydrolase